MTRVSLEEHRARILARLPAPRVETRPLEACLGSVLAEEVVSALPLPPFTNSAMDGFALSSSDFPDHSPFTMPVAGDIAAGDTNTYVHKPGYAWRIMTGAMMPTGCDTVVKVEDTDHLGTGPAPAEVTCLQPVAAGANVRQRGEALAPGTSVFTPGQLLDATALSACASVGYGQLTVFAPPKVVVVTTGSELVPPGAPVELGQIPNSNASLLTGLVREAGAEVLAAISVADEVDAFTTALDAVLDAADLIITVGGISAGAFEVVRQALQEDTTFYAVAQQPGGPQGVGAMRAPNGRVVPVICVPGNPVSVYVTFHIYVREAIARLAGVPEMLIPQPVTTGQIRAQAGAQWASPPKKVQFMPAAIRAWIEVSGERIPQVAPVHALGSRSHLVVSMAEADGLVMVPIGVGEVAVGDAVTFIPTRHPYCPPTSLPTPSVAW